MVRSLKSGRAKSNGRRPPRTSDDLSGNDGSPLAIGLTTASRSWQRILSRCWVAVDYHSTRPSPPPNAASHVMVRDDVSVSRSHNRTPVPFPVEHPRRSVERRCGRQAPSRRHDWCTSLAAALSWRTTGSTRRRLPRPQTRRWYPTRTMGCRLLMISTDAPSSHSTGDEAGVGTFSSGSFQRTGAPRKPGGR